LLGWERAYPKTAYASVLFGDTPEDTWHKADAIREQGFKAAKFGWGDFGLDLAVDEAHVHAAREGLGPDAALMVDAGTIWGDDVEAAAARLPVLEACDVVWFEEPFATNALMAYQALSRRIRGSLRLAAGEGGHEPHMARNLIGVGRIGYVQIDAGRIGGLTSAYEVARYAEAHDVHYVNHTFTTPLALSASLQPFAGMKGSTFCEYPTESSLLAQSLTVERIVPDDEGAVYLPEGPGLGMMPRHETIAAYIREVDIVVDGEIVYTTPILAA
jgi:L-alanine-DL-glutamate epimerase-like enolase superfamily enzyme